MRQNTITRHSSNADIRALQQQLNAAGAKISVDGILGNETQNAVRRFQRQSGLITDGRVGADTQRALASHTDPAPLPRARPGTAVPDPVPTVASDATGFQPQQYPTVASDSTGMAAAAPAMAAGTPTAGYDSARDRAMALLRSGGAPALGQGVIADADQYAAQQAAAVPMAQMQDRDLAAQSGANSQDPAAAAMREMDRRNQMTGTAPGVRLAGSEMQIDPRFHTQQADPAKMQAIIKMLRGS